MKSASIFKNHKPIFLAVLLALSWACIPCSSWAENPLTIPVPNGWVNVTHGMTESPYGPIPGFILESAKNADIKLTAYDAKAWKMGQHAYLNLFELHGALSEDSEKFFWKKGAIAS